MRRLEEEQREFHDFLARLRMAEDKAEFDQFMAERRARIVFITHNPPLSSMLATGVTKWASQTGSYCGGCLSPCDKLQSRLALRNAGRNLLGTFRGQASLPPTARRRDRKSTRLNSSHVEISYAVFCLKKKKQTYSHDFSTNKKKKNQ